MRRTVKAYEFSTQPFRKRQKIVRVSLFYRMHKAHFLSAAKYEDEYDKQDADDTTRGLQ